MASSSPKITVLIPTFNRAKYLAECLDSILSQTLPASQILVINDASTDNTQQVLEPYRNKIDYYETPQVGKPGVLNFGLEKTTGEYLWIFDDDDVALPNALERFVTPLVAQTNFGFSYSTFYYSSTQTQSDRIGPIQYELEIPDLENRGFLAPLLENNYLGGAALFARTQCYLAVGQFDPKLVRSQDYEMAIRIVRRFTGVRVPGGATFHYRQHDGLRGSTRDRFAASLQLNKWLEYDQIFFRKLYKELPLSDYLPPNAAVGAWEKQALLQRLMVMARRLLMPEVMMDLRELARLTDPCPLSLAERAIVRTLVDSWYVDRANVANQREFLDEIRQLSAASKAIRSLRRELFWANIRWCKQKPDLRRISEMLQRSVHLYF